MYLAADVILLGLCVTGQQVPQLLVRLGNCIVVSLLGFLEHLLSLLNLHLAGRDVYRHKDGVLRLRGFLEILHSLGPSCNSLGETLALLGQPLLFNHSEDCNYVREVFLVVPTGVYGHAEVGRVRKLDLEDLKLFLGRDNVYHRDVWNGRPMRLSFFALSVLQLLKSLGIPTPRNPHYQVLANSICLSPQIFQVTDYLAYRDFCSNTLHTTATIEWLLSSS